MNTCTANPGITFEPKITLVGHWIKLQIITVTYGYEKILKGGEWVNSTQEPKRFEDEILTLEEYFETYKDAEKYIQTKQFKQLFKVVEKNWR